MRTPARPAPVLDRRHWLTLGAAGLCGPALARSRPGAVDPRHSTLSLLLASDPEPPYVLEEGHPEGDGLDIDIAREALRLGGGYQLSVQRMPWKRALGLLERGEADFSPGLSVTPERREFLAFSEPYGKPVRHEIYTRRQTGLRLRHLDELGTLRVGVVAGYVFPARLTASFGARVEHGLNLAAVLRMLVAGHVDAVVSDEYAARWQVREMRLDRILQRQALGFDSGLATQMAFSMRRPGFQDALAAMNRGLLALARGPGWSRFESVYL